MGIVSTMDQRLRIHLLVQVLRFPLAALSDISRTLGQVLSEYIQNPFRRTRTSHSNLEICRRRFIVYLNVSIYPMA